MSSYPLDPSDLAGIESKGGANQFANTDSKADVPESRFAGPVGALIWIVVAWIVGMLVFEMTAISDGSTRDRIVRPAPQVSAMVWQTGATQADALMLRD